MKEGSIYKCVNNFSLKWIDGYLDDPYLRIQIKRGSLWVVNLILYDEYENKEKEITLKEMSGDRSIKIKESKLKGFFEPYAKIKNMKGVFKITKQLLYSDHKKTSKALSLVFKETKIIKAEEIPYEIVKYWALSNNFRELEEGEITPEYEVIVNTEVENIDIKFEELKV